ncbi:hypothetical protein [Microbacterium sp. NPDC058389]|uniref:hypothetical protein n=1 Tax=Microbacterium sp. NPDC058389 TaxID=3346475 RepID=UPI0036555990
MAFALLATACTAQPASGPKPSDSAAAPATVQVETRSLTSTVVLSGTIVPNPAYLVESPAAGQVRLDTATVPGANVEAGQPVAHVGNESISIPAAGTVTDVLAVDGAQVVPRIPVAVVAYEGFGVVVEVPPSEQYRMYEGALSALVNVVGGPSGLECTLVTPRQALDAADGAAVLCLLPAEAAVASGLDTKVGLNTASKTDVATLPLQSVSGRADQGKVSRVNADGTHETVTVELGITDGVYIEIVSGLQLGDTVTAFPPGIG